MSVKQVLVDAALTGGIVVCWALAPVTAICLVMVLFFRCRELDRRLTALEARA